jgi:ribosomal protein S14
LIARKIAVVRQVKDRRIFRVAERRKLLYKFLRLNASSIGCLPLVNFQPYSIKNNCLVTGESRGIYRRFKLSRYMIKKHFASLYGLRNSSW